LSVSPDYSIIKNTYKPGNLGVFGLEKGKTTDPEAIGGGVSGLVCPGTLCGQTRQSSSVPACLGRDAISFDLRK